jgi:hypothetical protein
MFILLIDVDDDTRSVVFNDLSLHDSRHTQKEQYIASPTSPRGSENYAEDKVGLVEVVP